MSIFNSNALFKTSFISCALASLLLATGCSNTESEVAANDKDIATVETTEIKTENVDATNNDTSLENMSTNSAVVGDTPASSIASLVTKNVHYVFFNPMIASDNFDAEQKACLEARDKELGKADIKAFYQQRFTDAELKELVDFYASETGIKLVAYSNDQLLIMNGVEIVNPAPIPNAKQLIEYRQFARTPVGKRSEEIDNNIGESSMMEALIPTFNAEFKRCKIDIDMNDIA